MARSRVRTGRQGAIFGLLLSATALLLASFGSRAANATHLVVTATQGSAYGYFASVSLFSSPQPPVGPRPTVTLPPTGSAVPITATEPTGQAAFGPAVLFTSGPITVSTQGTTGPTGFVTSTASIQTINTSGNEVFTAASLSSTCTADETGVTGSTTVTNGVLVLQDPDPSVSGEAGEQIVNVPVNPAPNTTYVGTVANVNDNFRYVFNEQIVNPDGSITVNAAHQYLLGPTAVGDLILGQVVCGVTTITAPTTTSTSTSTSTTVASTTTSSSTSTTVASTTTSSSTSTTVAPTTTSSSTSTTVAPTTSTTTGGTTSTTVAQTTTTAAECMPGQDGAKPGYGLGDKNHVHCGPPGLTGMKPVASSSEGSPPLWPLIAAGGVLLISLLAPVLRRGRRSEG